ALSTYERRGRGGVMFDPVPPYRPSHFRVKFAVGCGRCGACSALSTYERRGRGGVMFDPVPPYRPSHFRVKFAV
ncbi:hypothetical protein CTI14_70455, partial [Methylobacterium radiotolerans]